MSQYRVKKADCDSLFEAKAALDPDQIAQASQKNRDLSESNRKLLDAITELKTFGKELCYCYQSSDSHGLQTVICENEALKEIIKALDVSEPMSPPTKEIKPKSNTSPSRNARKKRRGVHVRSSSLNASQWDKVLSSNQTGTNGHKGLNAFQKNVSMSEKNGKTGENAGDDIMEADFDILDKELENNDESNNVNNELDQAVKSDHHDQKDN